jgi:hypothetical protein
VGFALVAASFNWAPLIFIAMASRRRGGRRICVCLWSARPFLRQASLRLNL